MKSRKGQWVKKIDDDNEELKASNFIQHSFELQLEQINAIYIGSLACWGLCQYQFHTDGIPQELKQVTPRLNQTVKLSTFDQAEEIQLHVPFAQFFNFMTRITHLAKIKYYCQVNTPEKSSKQARKQMEECEKEHDELYKQLLNSKKKKQQKLIKQKIIDNEHKKNLSKRRGKKVIPIRIQIFISRQIFNEKSSMYSDNLKKLDNMQTLINTLKPSSQEYRDLKQEIEKLIEEYLYYQKLSRSLLLYLMEKCQIKVLNRSFIKPPPKLNYLMREYRRITIGLITKNKRNQRKIQWKIANWKSRFQMYSLMYPCIADYNQKAYNNNYYTALPKECLLWKRRSQDFGLEMTNQETFKFQVKMGMIERTQSINSVLTKQRKKIMEQIGAFGFEEGEEDSQSDQQQNEASKKLMDTDQFRLMKRNEALMEKFQTQNKYFKVHKTPSSMISQLKPYQGQALQWMKYRQGKITVEQLFQKQYQQQDNDFQFERKLSPFWEQLQSISGEKFFVNYLTGQFTKVFHHWKSIRGGILADQMGLGKTVMTLSLLADEDWEGINLIVVPVAVLLQWKQQIRKHCGESVLVYQFHSNLKNRRKINLNDYHIIIITYATLGHQYKAFSTKQPTEGQKYLFDYDFQRVVLDQAHNIRGTQTLQFNAVMNLRSKYSWCLTGTLIQNSEQDLFAIFKFLRVQVFSQEAWWNQYIKNAGCTQAKMNVIQTVLRPIVLRRTKASTSNEGQAIIKLTGKTEFIIRPQFNKLEARIYEKLQTGVKKYFRSNIEAGRNYTHVFQIISKLRQFCCHPALIFGSDVEQVEEKDIQKALKKFLQGKVAGEFKQEAVSAMLKGDQNCVICLTEPDQQNAVLTECGHYFCQPCIKRTISINPNCPVCRKPLTTMSYIKKSDFTIQEDLKDLKESSKITAILEILEQIYDRGQKCVIFTQWIKIISILEQKLLLREMQFETVVGGMTVQKRQKAIKRFKQKDRVRFLIISIRAGATGLNLANANNVMICDPWWNPSHEDQAIGRVHRIGQTKDVNVYKFIMKKSIEEKIEKMHEGKRKLANQVMMQKGSLRDEKVGGAEELIKLLES